MPILKFWTKKNIYKRKKHKKRKKIIKKIQSLIVMPTLKILYVKKSLFVMPTPKILIFLEEKIS